MRRLLVGFVGLVGLVGCITSGDVPCGDRVCPGGTVCESQTMSCISEEAQTVCRDQSIADGEVCSGLNFAGICREGLCLPGCGDGVIGQATEECDDGNFRSHDGCSSSCTVEIPSWKQMEDPWSGMLGHVAGYHAGNDFMLVLGGQSLDGLRTEQWAARTGVPAWFPLPPEPPGVMPSPRDGAMMAYDSGRQKLVLFGGVGSAFFNDTWEWDYQSGWSKPTLVGALPPPRHNAEMVYDSAHAKMVMYGGYGLSGALGDTWEYDGTTWLLRTTSGPAARQDFGLAYDDVNDRTVLFGGYGGGVIHNDTWHYDNGTWTQVSPSNPPAKRYGHSMAWDPDRDTVILFGGLAIVGSSAPVANDTWEYNGSTWIQIDSAQTPPARSRATLTPVPRLEIAATQLVLIGGAQVPGKPPLNDVWRLEPTGWVDISPTFLPPARFGAPLVYNDARREMNLLGGLTDGGARLDAWSFQESWNQLSVATRPIRFFHTLAFDPKREVVVLFGGVDSNTTMTNDTYEHVADNEFAWTKSTTVAAPPARRSGVLAFDGDVLVLFGGAPKPNELFADTWTYDGVAWKQETGPMAPAATLQAAADYDPVHERLVLFDSAGVTWSHHAGAWQRLVEPGAGAPPGRDGASMTFDWQTKRMLLVGGQGAELYTDVWELDDTTWRKLDVPGGGPLPRSYFGFASNAFHRETFLVGGAGPGFVSYGDTWTLQYRSQAAPEEDCNNVELDDAGNEILDSNGNKILIDDDGDLHANHHDPDCCAHELENTCLTR